MTRYNSIVRPHYNSKRIKCDGGQKKNDRPRSLWEESGSELTIIYNDNGQEVSTASEGGKENVTFGGAHISDHTVTFVIPCRPIPELDHHHHH